MSCVRALITAAVATSTPPARLAVSTPTTYIATDLAYFDIMTQTLLFYLFILSYKRYNKVAAYVVLPIAYWSQYFSGPGVPCFLAKVQSEARFPSKRNRLRCVRCVWMETGLNASACVGKQPIIVATASTEHPIGCLTGRHSQSSNQRRIAVVSQTCTHVIVVSVKMH